MAYPSSWDFEDAFTISGGDVDPLGNHTPTVAGEAWSDAAGNTDNLIIDDPAYVVYHAAAGGLQWNGAQAIHDSGAANNGWEDDHWAEGRNNAPSTDRCMVAVRCTLDGTSQIEGYAAYHNSGSNLWTVWRLDQAISSTVLDIYFDNSPQTTDDIAIEASGTSMNMYLNGVDISTSPTSDSTYPSGTPGLIGRKTGSSSLAITEFRAAGVVAAGAATPHYPFGLPLKGPFTGPIG